MPQESTTSKTGLPAVPERAVRPQEEIVRSSEESERKRLLRNSYQSTNTVVPSIMERPSEEMSERGGPYRQQVAQWAPPPSVLVTDSPQQIQQEQRPPGPVTYGRSTSNDYTVYGDTATPTPAGPTDPYGPQNAIQYRGDHSYFQHPYRRAGPASVRDTTETNSIRAGRYTPLATGQTPKKPASITPARTHWTDGYDPSMDEGAEEMPQKPSPPRRRGTSLYLVREGGDGDSPPPGDMLRLPLTHWVKGPVRNRAYSSLSLMV